MAPIGNGVSKNVFLTHFIELLDNKKKIGRRVLGTETESNGREKKTKEKEKKKHTHRHTLPDGRRHHLEDDDVVVVAAAAAAAAVVVVAAAAADGDRAIRPANCWCSGRTAAGCCRRARNAPKAPRPCRFRAPPLRRMPHRWVRPWLIGSDRRASSSCCNCFHLGQSNETSVK